MKKPMISRKIDICSLANGSLKFGTDINRMLMFWN